MELLSRLTMASPIATAATAAMPILVQGLRRIRVLLPVGAALRSIFSLERSGVSNSCPQYIEVVGARAGLRAEPWRHHVEIIMRAGGAGYNRKQWDVQAIMIYRSGLRLMKAI